MTYLIMAGGTIRDYEFTREAAADADRIICADGGARHLVRMGLVPHDVIGDLDSIDPSDRALFEQKGVTFTRFPRKKNATDTELAVDLAISRSPGEVIIMGALGTRLDHTLASVFLLKKLLDAGIRASIVDEHNTACLIDNRLELTGRAGDTLSIIPACGEASGIHLEGFEYPLTDARIPMGSSLGISNRILGQTAVVRVEKGLLLVILARD